MKLSQKERNVLNSIKSEEKSSLEIRNLYRELTGKNIFLSTLHLILWKLTTNQLIIRRIGHHRPENRGGNRIAYYRLSDSGLQEVNTNE